jgi:hypothetical protein
MKKTLLILAGLTLGTAAIAQDVPSQPAADPAASAPADTPNSSAVPDGPTGSAMTPPPAPDAAMTTQSGTDASAGASSAAMPTPTTADMSSYPRCARGVTDKCVQRGRR